MTNLLEMLTEQFTPELVQQASNLVGERPSVTQSALTSIAPILLNGLINKGSTRSGAEQVLGALSQNKVDGGMLDNLSGLLGGGDSSQGLMKVGGSLVSLLLGNKAGAAAELLGSMLGTNSRSSSMLMSLAAPILGALVSKVMKGQGLDAGGLSNLLLGQKKAVAAAMPSGFDAIFEPDTQTSSTNYSSAPRESVERPAYSTPAPTAPEPSSIWRWLLPLIALAVLALLAYNYLGGVSTPDVNVPDVTLPDVKGIACAPIGQIESAIAGLPAIAADTNVADLRTGFDGIKTAYNTLSQAVSAVTDFKMDDLVASFGSLETVISGLASDTLGDGATAVQTEIDKVKAAGASLKSTVGC